MHDTNSERTHARSPAAIYDELFVPALFTQWAPTMAELAGLRGGQRVLDVACGTGALTCQLPERVAPNGSVVGLDANPEMLEVARGKSARVEWILGRAEALPFADASFDAVVSQFGLMFFTDRRAALRELRRVLRPGARFAVAVWDRIEHAPGYAALGRCLEELFEPEVVASFRSPFALGEPRALLELCDRAEIQGARVSRHTGAVRFASLDALLRAERACVWTLGGLLDDSQFERLLVHARPALEPFIAADGGLRFECPALILSGARR
jgi:SAM-dependent methyltransferase